MGPFTAIGSAAAGTLKFTGRASRSEYWWTALLFTIIALVCAAVDSQMVLSVLQAEGEAGLFTLRPFDFAVTYCWLLTLPTFLSLSVRRLHDAGFSGLWLLLYIVPFGALALLILHVMPSDGKTTIYGAPATALRVGNTGKPVPLDAQKRAMQGYGLLFDKDKQPTQQQLAARKAEVSDYYRSRVTKSAPSV